jgi:hypothetical protein
MSIGREILPTRIVSSPGKLVYVGKMKKEIKLVELNEQGTVVELRKAQ